ncbi:ferritin-like domain-containing protein [Anaerotruncus rubiinfantis]|uniref:ferritin-like domain-containing protein n=1 Tax=Anaerotruncus rubiinfantis TaxID=1720200 RepID=UPI0018995152|nr:manganese catalase family protein [Anaerotruncus rubiinfantis]
MSNEISVSNPAPYPPVAVSAPNQNYAQILSLSLASSAGEFGAIAQYVYQSWVFRPQDPQLARLLLRISMVEMKHLDILGQLIVLLGGDPKYQALCPPACPMWNARMLDYTSDLCAGLHCDIRGEKSAYEGYLRAAQRIRDPYVSQMLERISLDEALHMQLFEEALRKLC